MIPTNKPNVEPKRPSRPVNITQYVINQPREKQHRMRVDWTADKRQWAVAIYLVSDYLNNDNNIILSTVYDARNHIRIATLKCAKHTSQYNWCNEGCWWEVWLLFFYLTSPTLFQISPFRWRALTRTFCVSGWWRRRRSSCPTRRPKRRYGRGTVDYWFILKNIVADWAVTTRTCAWTRSRSPSSVQ